MLKNAEAANSITNLQQMLDNSLVVTGAGSSGTIDLTGIDEKLKKLEPYLNKCSGKHKLVTALKHSVAIGSDAGKYTDRSLKRFSLEEEDMHIADLLDGYTRSYSVKRVPSRKIRPPRCGTIYTCGDATTRYKCVNGEMVHLKDTIGVANTIKCTKSRKRCGDGGK